MSRTRDEIFNAVQDLVAKKDLFAASEFVLRLTDESKILEAFHNLIRDGHHKAKSTEQVIHFGHAGIHYCLARAAARDAAADPAAARELRFAAKRMATDVASFTWPGWDEPGVTISPDQLRQGLAFARYSVRQLHELEPTVSQLHFTYWFLGAQLVANRQYGEAVKVFELASDYGKAQGDAPDGVTMLEGYVALGENPRPSTRRRRRGGVHAGGVSTAKLRERECRLLRRPTREGAGRVRATMTPTARGRTPRR